MKVNSVHKIADVHSQSTVFCYLKLLIASLAVLALTWIQLDIADIFRSFFAPLINSVQ